MPRPTRNGPASASLQQSSLLLGAALATVFFGAACSGGGSSPDQGSGGIGTAGAGVAGAGIGGSAAGSNPGTGSGGTSAGSGGDMTSGGSPASAGAGAGAGAGGAGTAGAAGRGGSGGLGASGAGGSGGANVPDNPPPALTGTMVNGTVKVNRATHTGALPAGFVGFSLEKSHLTDGFLVPTHTALVNMFKLLGPSVVRIGADDVNTSVWTPSAVFQSPGNTSHNIGTAEVDALAEFLTATQWKTIYAVNMRGSSTPQTAVTELQYVVPKLGASLLGVEIGNELNLYNDSNVETTWHSYAQAIHTNFSGTKVAGPGVFEDINYATKLINGEGKVIDIVTHHYYRAQAGTSGATLANLMNLDPAVASQSQALATATKNNNIAGGYRWGEMNSYSSHGVKGVSNALASALWGINFMMTTAGLGSAGVNFHGGGQNMDGNTCPNGVSSCDKPFYYSPLIEVDSRVTEAAPLYYGMLLVTRMGTGDMLSTTTSAGGSNLRAYTVAPADGSTTIVLVNCEASTGVNVTVDAGAAVSSATAMYLRGPSLTSTTGVTLGEAAVSATGTWVPKSPYTLSHTGNMVTVPVPAASAVLITVH